MEDLEKWLAEFQETDEYKRDSYHWDDMARKVWQAATERAAGIADETKFAEPADSTDKLHNYVCCKIAAAIRK